MNTELSPTILSPIRPLTDAERNALGLVTTKIGVKKVRIPARRLPKSTHTTPILHEV